MEYQGQNERITMAAGAERQRENMKGPLPEGLWNERDSITENDRYSSRMLKRRHRNERSSSPNRRRRLSIDWDSQASKHQVPRTPSSYEKQISGILSSRNQHENHNITIKDQPGERLEVHDRGPPEVYEVMLRRLKHLQDRLYLEREDHKREVRYWKAECRSADSENKRLSQNYHELLQSREKQAEEKPGYLQHRREQLPQVNTDNLPELTATGKAEVPPPKREDIIKARNFATNEHGGYLPGTMVLAYIVEAARNVEEEDDIYLEDDDMDEDSYFPPRSQVVFKLYKKNNLDQDALLKLCSTMIVHENIIKPVGHIWHSSLEQLIDTYCQNVRKQIRLPDPTWRRSEVFRGNPQMMASSVELQDDLQNEDLEPGEIFEERSRPETNKETSLPGKTKMTAGMQVLGIVGGSALTPSGTNSTPRPLLGASTTPKNVPRLQGRPERYKE
ncbi:hypothetical protein EJ08DRAFT_681781 [Tothia fuscella]|uniref:Uncharacterized protein n=1 Tax=Tothia fuscella TaxID=1048955 RepID=A0A9P4TVN5_9PEZI|nr:hypothetical protein EJ08DRAFT_681781 [Tothia fuscella]